jgi:hypothetical protein
MDFYRQVHAVQAGSVNRVSGFGVCSTFLIETITKINELYIGLLQITQLEHLLKKRSHVSKAKVRFRGKISVALYDNYIGLLVDHFQ